MTSAAPSRTRRSEARIGTTPAAPIRNLFRAAGKAATPRAAPKSKSKTKGGDERSGRGGLRLAFAAARIIGRRHRRPVVGAVPLAKPKPAGATVAAVLEAAAEIMGDLAERLAEAFGLTATATSFAEDYWFHHYENAAAPSFDSADPGPAPDPPSLDL